MTLPITFIWAVWTAEGSDYLEKLDARVYPSGSVQPGAPSPDLVDIWHARWATTNAITAIDLCAATMGRLFCGHTGTKELDLRAFDRKSNRGRRDRTPWDALSGVMKWVCREPGGNSPLSADELRELLPEKFLDWVKTTLANDHYKDLLSARNPFTHSTLPRHLFAGAGGYADRTRFQVQSKAMDARDVVVDSASLALDRVRAFVDVVDQHR